MKKMILHLNDERVKMIESKAEEAGTGEAREFAVKCREEYEKREETAKENVAEATGEKIEEMEEITVVVRIEVPEAAIGLVDDFAGKEA